MRPKNTKTERWVISHERWFPTKQEALHSAKATGNWGEKLPYDIDNVVGARTMFGTYRRDTWRLREYVPTVYKGQQIKTGPMSLSKAQEVAHFHPDKKLVKIKNSYYYVEK